MIADKPQTKEALYAEIRDLEQERFELKRQIAESERNLDRARDQVSDFSDQVDSTKISLTAAKARVMVTGDRSAAERIERQLEDLTGQLEKAQEQLKAVSHTHTEKQKAYQARVSPLDELIEEKKALAEQVEVLLAEHHQVKGEEVMTAILQEHDALLNEVQDLRVRLNKHHASIIGKLAQWPALQAKLLNSRSFYGADTFSTFELYADCLARQAGKGNTTLGGISPSLTLYLPKMQIDALLAIPGGERRIQDNRQNAAILRERCRRGEI
jgi:chromosome segregation ATPase